MPATTRPLLNMMQHVYRIREFSELFETNDSRKRSGPMEWVKMRTKHDGRSFRRISRLAHARDTLLGWYLMLQVAAKMPARGLLADVDGPLDAEDLEDKTGFKKNVFASAMNALVDPKIGWLERLEWEPERSFDQNLARLGIHRSGPADHGSHRQTPADDGRQRQGKKDAPPSGNAADNGTSPAPTGKQQQTTADNGRNRQPVAGSGVQDSTGQNSTDIPPTVPQGGQEETDFARGSGDTIASAEEAKRLICEKILGGRNPARAWSYEAQDNLARILPLPLAEIETIGWFYRLAPSDEIPELRDRRTLTETTLVKYWGDIFTRAAAYRSKNHTVSSKNGTTKKEPPLWRETLRWLHGQDVHLKLTFDELDRDTRTEYQANVAAFRASTASPGVAVPVT